MDETEVAALNATSSVKLTALARIEPTRAPSVSPIHSEQPQRLAGNGVIVESGFMGHGPLSRTNEWIGYVNDRVVSVLAGAKYRITGAPSDTGELIIAEYDPVTGERLGKQEFFSEGDTGALSILDVEGTRLILTTTRQQIMAFDLAQMAFVGVDEVTAPLTRRIGDGVLRLEQVTDSMADTPQRIWDIELTRAQSVNVVRLVTGKGEQNWSVATGEGASTDSARVNVRTLTNGPAAASLRLFDVRGSLVLFVAGRKAIWVYDVQTGTWSNGDELFEKSQPYYLGTQVPVYAALLEQFSPRPPEITPTLTDVDGTAAHP
ncbi:MAG TPA: hypothetical protein PLC98_25010 [Anaerolineales bacterium]|nr:hypothetical protein [Anaerolineales bacterium]